MFLYYCNVYLIQTVYYFILTKKFFFQACGGCPNAFKDYKCNCTGLKGAFGVEGIRGMPARPGDYGDVGYPGPSGPKGEKGSDGEYGAGGDKGPRVSKL